MNKFIITQQEVNLMIQDLREAPAKYSFRPLQILNGMKPYKEESQVEEAKEKAVEAKSKEDKQDKKEEKK